MSLRGINRSSFNIFLYMSNQKTIRYEYNGQQAEVEFIEGLDIEFQEDIIKAEFGIQKDEKIILKNKRGNIVVLRDEMPSEFTLFVSLFSQEDGSIVPEKVNPQRTLDGYDSTCATLQSNTSSLNNHIPPSDAPNGKLLNQPTQQEERKEEPVSRPEAERKASTQSLEDNKMPVSHKTMEEEKVVYYGRKSTCGSSSSDEEQDQHIAAEDKRQPVGVALLGHVSVGKSTICGRIMIAKETIDKQEVKRCEEDAKGYKSVNCFVRYIMDITEEERTRGITVETGKTIFNTESKRITLYDTPGHKQLVSNMIMGAAMADIGVLVVSAKKGDFESGLERGGETLNHILLARAQGIQTLIIAVNKMDDPSVMWSQERFEQIKKEILDVVTEDRLYLEKNLSWVPLSGFTGANIVEKVEPTVCKWYEGPTLLELIEQIPVPKKESKDIIRISVLDCYKKKIHGKVYGGAVGVGSKLLVMPYYCLATIDSINDGSISYAKEGESIMFTVKGLPKDMPIYKGCILCNLKDPCKTFNEFIANVKIVGLKKTSLFSAGYKCMLHLNTLLEQCTVQRIISVSTLEGKKIENAIYATKGSIAKCIVSLDNPIAAEKISNDKKSAIKNTFARFSLRDGDETVGIGSILKYKPLSYLIFN